MVAVADADKSKNELIAELASIRKLVPRLERLTSEYRESEKLQGALYEIAELAGSAEDMDHFYSAIHRIVGNLMYARNFYVALHDLETGMFGFPYFVDSVDTSRPDKLPFEKVSRGMTAWLMRQGKSKLITRADLDRLVKKGELDVVGKPPHMWLGAPLMRERRVVGAIVVQSYADEWQYSRKDLELLTFVSQHISTALERKQSREDLERAVEERTRELTQVNQSLQQEIKERQRAEKLQAALFRIAELTNTAQNMDEFYSKLHAIVGELIYARNFYIAGIQRETGLLLFPYRVDEFDDTPKPRRAGRGLTEYVIRHGDPVLLDREARDRLEESGEIVRSGSLMENWMGVPLRSGDQILGVLAVQSYTPEHTYRTRDLELLTFVSHHIAAALQRKQAVDSLHQAYSELERRVQERTQELYEANRILESQIAERKRIERRLIHDALHDALTGLPNRNLFKDRLIHALKMMNRNPNFHFAVLFLDLDRFKIVNDSLGHLVGDELLKEVSKRILACMRESDTVARLGGDEFAILLESLAEPGDARIIAERILERITEPFVLGEQEVFTSTSIGIAYSHERYTKPEDLLRDADSAMYRAKESGRQRIETFDESMHRHAVEQLEIESYLHRAVEKQELVVHYQPIVHLETRQITGFEALVRWQHPNRGLLKPGAFIELARETGVIISLDWAVLETAARQMKVWLSLFPEGRSPVLHVNFSGKHFSQGNFTERLQELISKAGLPPGQLRLEVDEAALLDKTSLVDDTFNHLKNLGVHLLLDDFGTRYSSLSYLHKFPMDTIKIDRSFVTRMLDIQENLEIIRTIHALARTLEMQVIAEGLESRELIDAVRELGCEYGQGYQLAKPMTAEEVTTMLQSGKVAL
ncbi:MAG: EAL domain-containing protein [Acidobacteriota bacterium]|nr:EAL domain-containing protein [Acidobacteriota bacterium]